jgi:DNA-binding NarL/FixJ family response regulator
MNRLADPKNARPRKDPEMMEAATERSKIRVLIADDNELFREGLISLLSECESIAVVGQARDGWQALEKTAILRPDVILMDIAMPRMDGVESTRRITAERGGVNVAVFTNSEGDDDLFAAVRAGATSYIAKTASLEELESAIQITAQGGSVVTPALARRLVEEFAAIPKNQNSGPKQTEKLTPREREVLELVATGASNLEIAERLVIAENTVKVHLRNMLDKLQVRNRQQAAGLAVQEGLVSNVRSDIESLDR